MSDWAAVVGTLGGVLVTLLATNARDRQRSRREKLWKAYEDRRHRLEQLYSTLEGHCDEYRAICSELVTTIGSGERPHVVDLPRPCDTKVAMLVGLYAAMLEPALRDVYEKEKAFAESVMQVVDGVDTDGVLTPKRERAWRVVAASLITSRFNELHGAISRGTSTLRAESAELERRYVAPMRSRE